MQVNRRVGLAAVAAGLAGTVLVPSAASARTQPVGWEHRPTVQIVADGLNTPRGLIYDAQNHRILVAEAGADSGNTGPCGIGEGGGKICFGNTGSILSYNVQTGKSHELVTGLPSESLVPAGTAVLGLEKLSLFHGQLNGVWGLLGTPHTRSQMGPGATVMGQVAHIDVKTGALTPYGDIAKYEINRWGKGQESDPYDLLTGSYGTVVANAGGHAVKGNIGGNDLVLVKPSGKIVQLAAFPQHKVKGNVLESVPDAVAQGPDGNFYVGELGGFPYTVGASRIWKVAPTGGRTLFAKGFTNIISMIFDHEGNLIVLEIARKSLLSPDQEGALIKVSPSGERTVLATTGLTNPGGVVQVGNAFYVTNFTTSEGGIGQLLKVTVPNP